MTNDELLERAVSAHRERSTDGQVQSSPAWHDLDAATRVVAFDETTRQRAVERALDADGHSGTVRAVLARLGR